MSEFETVAKVGDIPEGEGRAFEYEDQMVAVFNDKGEYRAIDDMCPHMGASLASGHFEDCVVTCPWHAWSFDTRDGTWCDNRRLKVDTYDVRVVGDEIQVKPAEKNAADTGGSPLGGAPSTSDASDPSSKPELGHPAEDNTGTQPGDGSSSENKAENG